MTQSSFLDVKAFNGQVELIMDYVKEGRELVAKDGIQARTTIARMAAGHKVCCDHQWFLFLRQQSRQG